jgi:hypothetical protein
MNPVRCAGIAALFVVSACEASATPPQPVVPPPPVAAKAVAFASSDARWGKFHSKRFRLQLPLPDGKTWRIDDHSKEELVATHEATHTRLRLLATKEEELVNRAKCEERARARGWVTGELTTVEDAVTVGPEAYDSRMWVALAVARPGAPLAGHVYLFGAFIRSCLLVHVTTDVPGANDEDVLSARLAVARARIVTGIRLDPPRTGDDGVPREDAARPR